MHFLGVKIWHKKFNIMKKHNKFDIIEEFDINVKLLRNKWSNLPGMLILMGTARSTTMSGSQWWHQSKLTSASILSSSIKKIIWKSWSETGSIFAPGFCSWKVLFFHIRHPLLCHDFYLFINSLFWCRINFPLPKVFHNLIEGTFSKSFEQCTFVKKTISRCA